MYRRGGNMSRVHYFLKRAKILKNLTPPLSEEEIIKRLARHLDEIFKMLGG